MVGVVTREPLDLAIQSWIAEATEKECYLVKVGLSPVLPYSVVYPIDSPTGYGSMANPEEERDFVYQITSVGEDVRQCGWMADKVQAAWLSKIGKAYEFPIVAEGLRTMWRSSGGLGSIVPSGEKLFESRATFRVRVGAA